MNDIPGNKRRRLDKTKKKDQSTPKSSSSEERSVLSKDKYLLGRHGFSVGRKIDSGTFATVRCAQKISDDEVIPLAVKVIDKSKASPLFTEKFLLRELQIWPRLRHRQIIQVEKMFQIDERVYIFMELAPGGSVIDYVQRYGAVQESVGRDWCKAMCQALRYCHRKGVAHRDIKCDNLLLDKDLQLKIGDFGFCCRSIDPHSGQSIFSDTYCGSSSYVSPEVIESQPYDPIAADIWSAGVCMYVILNNAMPFDDSNLKRMHDDQVTKRWEFPPKAQKNLSVSAMKLISRMLEPDPAMRPNMDQVLSCSWFRAR